MKYIIILQGKFLLKARFKTLKDAEIKCHELICIAECKGKNSSYIVAKLDDDNKIVNAHSPHEDSLTDGDREAIFDRVCRKLLLCNLGETL